jgi:hypothetical protein
MDSVGGGPSSALTTRESSLQRHSLVETEARYRQGAKGSDTKQL